MFNGKEKQAFGSGFFVNGVLVELRTITSQKNKEWSKTIAKVAEIGKVFELECDDASVLAAFETGANVHCVCNVDFYQNLPKFKLLSIAPYEQFINQPAKPVTK